MLSRLVVLLMIGLILSGCFHPPYNNFQNDQRVIKTTTFGTVFGTTVGAIAGSVFSGIGAGAVIGGVSGAIIGYQKSQRPQLIKELQDQGIEYVRYGDTETLIVPTDNYFYFNSPELNDLAYPGLVNIVRLLRFYPCTPIFVAGFTDDVGSERHKKLLSQAQAEAMLTFLWANGVAAERMHPEGYGDKHAIGDNRLIRGSAFNRRLEIQWVTATTPPRMVFAQMTK